MHRLPSSLLLLRTVRSDCWRGGYEKENIGIIIITICGVRTAQGGGSPPTSAYRIPRGPSFYFLLFSRLSCKEDRSREHDRNRGWNEKIESGSLLCIQDVLFFSTLSLSLFYHSSVTADPRRRRARGRRHCHSHSFSLHRDKNGWTFRSRFFSYCRALPCFSTGTPLSSSIRRSSFQYPHE